MKLKNSVTYKIVYNRNKNYQAIDLDVCVEIVWCFIKLFDILFKHYGFLKTITGKNIVVTARYVWVPNCDSKFRRYFKTYFCFFSNKKDFDSEDYYKKFMTKCLHNMLANNKFLSDNYPLRGNRPEYNRDIPFTRKDGYYSATQSIFLTSLEIRIMTDFASKT